MVFIGYGGKMAELHLLLWVACTMEPDGFDDKETKVEMVGQASSWVLFRVTVDTSQYLIVDDFNGVSIIKHK